MTEKDSVLHELSRLKLPEGSYMVMGSGILDALGIRKALDVDLVVNDEVYARLRKAGWNERIASSGAVGIEHGVFQAYDRWNDEAVVKTLEELLVDAEWVNGVPYNSLAKLSLYKARRGRGKDFADLILINQYFESR
jgi:hypothetical protein